MAFDHAGEPFSPHNSPHQLDGTNQGSIKPAKLVMNQESAAAMMRLVQRGNGITILLALVLTRGLSCPLHTSLHRLMVCGLLSMSGVGPATVTITHGRCHEKRMDKEVSCLT
jgi:hypothetical protein